MNTTPRFSPSHRCTAFSLIEVLLVISVIMIMVAIISPSIIATKRKARKVLCITNLGQLHTGLLLYSNDYSDWLTPNHDGFIRNSNTASWTLGNMMDSRESCNIYLLNQSSNALLSMYINGKSVFKCPEDNTKLVRSYSLNGWINPFRESGPLRWVDRRDNAAELVVRKLAETGTTSELISFIHEREDSINDGYFAVASTMHGEKYVDLPFVDRIGNAHAYGFSGLVTMNIMGRNVKSLANIKDVSEQREYRKFRSHFVKSKM